MFSIRPVSLPAQKVLRSLSLVLGLAGLGACTTTHSSGAGSGGTSASGGRSSTSGGAVAFGGSTAEGGASSTGGLGGNSNALGGAGGNGGAAISSSAGGAGGAAATGGSGSANAGGIGGAAAGGSGGRDAATDAQAVDGGTVALEQLQRYFVDLRFGMFIHFGILTYTGSWAQGNLDITQFNPTGLDCAQWAAAAASAGIKYGVLTSRHHDGFALWPSKASKFNVGNVPWKNGQGDVVRCYVDAFRNHGLLPGLYYSIWDTTQGVAAGSISTAKLDYIKTQLTELLTNYGPIPILVIDGWSWQMGHKAIAYQEIYELVKSLQPNCLVTDHTHVPVPWDVDIVNYEEPKGAWAPAGNAYPSQQGTKVNSSGGNDWFWAPDIGGLMSVSDIVTKHLMDLEPKWTNFLLNCPPNRTGTLDTSIVTLLGQVGAAWSPNNSRPALPAQGPQNELPYAVVSATATSANAGNAIDGINDSGTHTMWQPTGALPQSITLDLGQSRADVGWLGCTPYASGDSTATTGNVTAYTVSVSADGNTFSKATSGTWTADAKMKVATFDPVSARYVRFQIDAANGNPAVTELTVGGVR
jgi:alpha-L-fucosidase